MNDKIVEESTINSTVFDKVYGYKNKVFIAFILQSGFLFIDFLARKVEAVNLWLDDSYMLIVFLVGLIVVTIFYTIFTFKLSRLFNFSLKRTMLLGVLALISLTSLIPIIVLFVEYYKIN